MSGKIASIQLAADINETDDGIGDEAGEFETEQRENGDGDRDDDYHDLPDDVFLTLVDVVDFGLDVLDVLLAQVLN